VPGNSGEIEPVLKHTEKKAGKRTPGKNQ